MMTKTVSVAFHELLKTLCLQEFPCGIGTWRNPNDKFAEGQYAVTLKDYGVQYEKMEVLKEYLNSGTWDVDTSWSNEAADLRSLAISQPWKLSGGKNSSQFIQEFFKSLRIIDKQITEIDHGILSMKNLEDLTLSVNLLRKVPSDNLPPNLKVLELCTNCLTSITSLCKNPPPLLHLGLSYNQLHSVDEYKYFTVEYWPSLMSLDLSYNNLNQLVELVDRLASLPNLRNLILQGNPMSLIPGYRGHVVDALKELVVFDDVHISADEKHHYKGLGKKKELILDEAQLTVHFKGLNGIPIPAELVEDEERQEFPVISTQYVIKYEMLADAVPTTAETQDYTTPVTREKSKPSVIEPTTVVTYYTEPRDWNEGEISLDYKHTHVVYNLPCFRDFLQQGINFTIQYKRTLSWPMTPGETEGRVATPETTAKKSAKGGAETPSKKGKDSKAKDKGGKGEKDKGKKKIGGRDTEMEMRADPPTFTDIGTYHIPLSHFLEGDRRVNKLCHCGGGPMPTKEELELLKVKELEEVKPETKGTKRRTPSAEKTKAKGKPGSAAGKKKDVKKEPDEDAAEEEPPVPPPITLDVGINLLRWDTAADSLKGL
nr:leucine-rich repeat-containing protein 43-like [Ciona intestinalis]|eukprot:XP_002125292.2 leucine-rich repeat-containing protein 43-like [Ciona intestinalis]